jgi:hypothetical protein
MWLRMPGVGFGSAIDWAAVFAFFAVGTTYYLAPVLGYAPERRGTLGTSLYLLLAYAGLSVLQFGILYLQMLDKAGRKPDELVMLAMMGFGILKLLFFFLALLLYVLGLQSLRLNRGDVRRRDDWPPDEARFGDR